MKRHGNLWEEIINFDNLLFAARKAQKGKRFRENILAFNYNLESEMEKIKIGLESKTYIPGNYKTFTIVESN